MHRRLLLVAALAMPLAARAQQAPPTQSARPHAPVTVDHVWSRAAMAGRTGVVYLSISTAGAPDTLNAVSSPIAATAELHESFNDNGVMKMRPVASLTVTPDKPVTLRPGGYHIMLVGLTRALNEGDSFPITLHFVSAGAVTVAAAVQKAGAAGMQMPAGTMPGMKM